MQIGLFQPLPDCFEVAVLLGQFGRHPRAQFTEPGAVRPDDGSGVAPIIVVDPCDFEVKARKGGAEGRDEVRVGRSRTEPRQDGFERGGIRKAGRGEAG